MRCSLVIRAYNEEAHIGRLFEGLSRQTVQDIEIILVDSGSMDATVTIAKSAGARVVHIPPEEFTFGRSLNLGMQAAGSELVVIASAHVYPVYPDWLERLLEPFSDERTVLTYGKQRAPSSGHFSEKQIYQRWYPEQSDNNQTQPFCNNANAAIRLSAWKDHSYDETLTGLEDLAWAKWALGEGYAIAYVADAGVIHEHDELLPGVYNRYRREGLAFKRIYPEAHFNLYDFFRMTSANIISDLWHAMRSNQFWKSLPSIGWYRIAQFWGTYHGYRQSLEWGWNLRQTFYYPHGMKIPGMPESRQITPIRYKE